MDDLRVVEGADDLEDTVDGSDVGGKALPSPAPVEAPAVSPAMSMQVRKAGTLERGS